jgi:RNA polymerase sigma factor (sigma-70 family)
MTPALSATILRTQTDARLLALAERGQERAFEAIVERYRRPMFRYCGRFLPESGAEDAVQQAFLNAWSAIRDGTEVHDLRRWLYRIARNAALDAAHKAGYDYDQLSEALRLSPGPEAEIERRWVIRETLAGVAALPARQRDALLRTAVQGQSQAKIAHELQITERAVGQLVHRARAAMRAAATALTPPPLVNWALGLGGRRSTIAEAIGDLATAGGAAGGASLSLKAGSIVAAAGLLAAGSGWDRLRPSVTRSPSAASARHGRDEVGADIRTHASAQSRVHAPVRRRQLEPPLASNRRRSGQSSLASETHRAAAAGSEGGARVQTLTRSDGPSRDIDSSGPGSEGNADGPGDSRQVQPESSGSGSVSSGSGSGSGDGDSDSDDHGSESSGSDSGSGEGDSDSDDHGSESSGSDSGSGEGDSDSDDHGSESSGSG